MNVAQGTSTTQTSSQSQARDKRWDKDYWAFRYRHSKSSMTFVLKALRLGSRLSVHAYVVEQDDVMVSMELLVSQYVDMESESFKNFLKSQKVAEEGATLVPKSAEGSAPSPPTPDSSAPMPLVVWTSFLKNLSSLHERCKKEMMVKLMPEVEDLASQMRFQEPQQQQAQGAPGGGVSQGHRGDPLRVDPRGGAEGRRGQGQVWHPQSPPHSEFDEDYDDDFQFNPQPPLYPPGSGGGGGRRGQGEGAGFGIPAAPGNAPHFGDSDLFGSYGRYGQVPGGYRPSPSGARGIDPEGGGSQFGPHHPIFGPEVNDPYAYGGTGIPRAGGNGRGAGGIGYHPPPRGARFDPFGPPVPPAANPPNSNPPPDAPPGFESWYS